MNATRDDVARLAGVSAATVSYVVNDGPRPVSAEARKKVQDAIDHLGYRPSAIARSLKTNRTHSVGIVISDILNPILASIEKVTEDLLLQQKYSLMVCNSDESPEREQILLHMLLGRGIDGIILLPTGDNLPLLFSVVESGKQIVLIDRQVRGLAADCVLFDNEAGAYQATTHLIALGHRRIGLLNLSSSLTPGRGRYRGYERALRDAGLPLIPDLIREGSFQAREGQVLVSQLLDSHQPPTALLASSNRLALSVLQELKTRGLLMPHDLALCVFDDVPFYAHVTPSITAVSYDVEEFASKTVRFLIERVNGVYRGEPRTALVSCQLQVRESTVGIRRLEHQEGDVAEQSKEVMQPGEQAQKPLQAPAATRP